MSMTNRRLGRLFCCLIFALLASALPAHAQEPRKTIVADTIYRADGSPALGSLVIHWPAFVSADGKPVAAGTMSVKIGANGAIHIPLIPTEGGTPAGLAYKVTISLDDGTSSTEFWTVPALSPATVAAVRASQMPATVAMQVVSREYVDAQIATAIRKNGDETIEGVKQFVESPQVPSPDADAAAANKEYVDAAVSAASPSPGNVLAVNKGGTGTNTFAAGRCVRMADDGLHLESAGSDCGNSTDSDTVDGRHAAAMQLRTAVDVREHGAVCNGTGDDAAAIQAALDAVNSTGGGVVKLPPGGLCRVGNTINMHNMLGVVLEGSLYAGSGSGSTQGSGLLWGGAAGGTVLDMQCSHTSGLRNMLIAAGMYGDNAKTGIKIDKNITPCNYNQSDTDISHVFVHCGLQGGCNNSQILVDISPISQSNVEDVRFRDGGTYAANGGTAIRVGWSANPKNLEFTHNMFYGDHAENNIRLEGGSAQILWNEFLASADVNIRVLSCSDPVRIVGNISEGDRQFFKGGCGYPSNQPLYIGYNNLDVNSNWKDSGLCRFEFTGAQDVVAFEGNHFDTTSGVPTRTICNTNVAQGGATMHMSGNLWPNNYMSRDFLWLDQLVDLQGFPSWSNNQYGETMGGNSVGAADAWLYSYKFTGVLPSGYRRRALGVVTSLAGAQTGQNGQPSEPVGPASYGSVFLGDGQLELNNVPPVNMMESAYTGAAGSASYQMGVIPVDAAGNRFGLGVIDTNGRHADFVSGGCVNASATLDANNYCSVRWVQSPRAATYDVLAYCSATSEYRKVASAPQPAAATEVVSYALASDPCAGQAYTMPTHDETSSAILRLPLGLKSHWGGSWEWYSDAGTTLMASINGATGAASFAGGVTANVTGNLTGNVLGSLTGNVTGTASGNAVVSGTPTAGNCTKWLNATTVADAGAPCGSDGGSGSTTPHAWNVTGRQVLFTNVGTGGTIDGGAGFIAFSGTSALMGPDADFTRYIQDTTAAEVDAEASYISGGATAFYRADHNPFVAVKGKFSDAATGVRVFCGFGSGGASYYSGSDVPANQEGAYLRYSTSAGDTTWKVVTGNGNSTTVTDTGVAFAAAPVLLQMQLGAASAAFTIGEVKTTVTATLPPAGTAHYVLCGVRTLNGAARTFNWASFYSDTD